MIKFGKGMYEHLVKSLNLFLPMFDTVDPGPLLIHDRVTNI